MPDANGTEWVNAGTISNTNGTVNLGGVFTQAALGTFSHTGGTINITGTLNNAGGKGRLGVWTGRRFGQVAGSGGRSDARLLSSARARLITVTARPRMANAFSACSAATQGVPRKPRNTNCRWATTISARASPMTASDPRPPAPKVSLRSQPARLSRKTRNC